MNQHTWYTLMLIVTSRSLALYSSHPATTHGDNSMRVAQSFILTGGLTLVLFGMLLLAYCLGSQRRTRIFRILAGGALFCLFAATLGAIGNMIQLGAAQLFGLTIGGVVVAGATAGAIAGAGGLLSSVVAKLPVPRLTLLSILFIAVGSLLALIQMAIILIALP